MAPDLIGDTDRRTTAATDAAPPAGLPAGVLDALIVTAVGTVSIVALALSDETGARAADPGAYALLLLAAAPLLLRRRWPSGALAAVTGVTLVSYGLGYPGGPTTVPLLAAIYVAAAAGHRRWSWLAAALFAGLGSGFRALVEQEPLVSVALNSALFVLVVLLGEVVHSRRALRREVRQRLRRAQAERARETERRVIDERMRIARELHDVMAHTIATMTVQAGVAADTLDDSPEDTRMALGTIRDSARQAMAELRATVSVLRDGDQPTPLLPAPGLAQLPNLINSASQDRLRVELVTPDADRPLPSATDLTAYRIIQEALTNVIRHADAVTATITVEHHAGETVVTIEDDGRGRHSPVTSGFGIQGMRERAQAVGGRLTAGPKPEGGYRVQAHLPTEGGA